MKIRLFKGFLVLFLITILFFPMQAYQGARHGLLLWFHNILPSLLPFIILSGILIDLRIADRISKFLYPVLGKLFGISPNACYPIVMGFLSGIPMGAKSTADITVQNAISKEEGNFLVPLCNNLSPMFIMGYIAISQLKLPRIKYVLFVAIYGSSIISALLYRFICRHRRHRTKTLHMEPVQSCCESKKEIPVFSFAMVDHSISNGFEVVTKIGGYIILFSILAQFIGVSSICTGWCKGVMMGILEITTGINQICGSQIPMNMKIVLVSVLSSFGGIASIAQTKSVLGDTGLSMKSYVTVKLLSAFIAFLLAQLYVTFVYLPI
jgi:sporulation integral membrane protein YlbJ